MGGITQILTLLNRQARSAWAGIKVGSRFSYSEKSVVCQKDEKWTYVYVQGLYRLTPRLLFPLEMAMKQMVRASIKYCELVALLIQLPVE